MSELTRATEQLYEAFRQYPLKPKIDGCPHCELDSADKSLHSRPLQDLTWSEFGVYPFKCMTTFGDEDDFKHFLPRLLELFVVDHSGSRYDVCTLFGKLQYANWESWTSRQVNSVQEFVRLWLLDLEVKQSGDREVDDEREELRSAIAEFDILAPADDGVC